MRTRRSEIARLIDHALLHPALTEEDLERGCRDAVRFQVASVCILPYYVKRCAELLGDSGVRVGTTISFPHGAQSTAVKLVETERALAEGAEELDLVVNVSRTLSGDWNYVEEELRGVVELVHAAGAKFKVIFETCYLGEEHKIRLCQICGELRVDWVKTSTGFGPAGATADDVRFLRNHSPPHVQVKAAGGIHTLERLLEMYAAGATRIGASRTVEILNQCAFE